MVRRDIKGIAKVTAKGRVYWYAWRERGAPRVHGEYGTPEFWASYDAAIRERHIPEPGRFRALVTLYKASADYQNLAASTKRQWGTVARSHRRLLRHAVDRRFRRSERIRPFIRQWRNKYAETPRTADMGMQVLSRVCAHAVELGKLTGQSLRGHQGAVFRRPRRNHLDRRRHCPHQSTWAHPKSAHAIDLAGSDRLEAR